MFNNDHAKHEKHEEMKSRTKMAETKI